MIKVEESSTDPKTVKGSVVNKTEEICSKKIA